jgi:hypothetical protein
MLQALQALTGSVNLGGCGRMGLGTGGEMTALLGAASGHAARRGLGKHQA